MWSWFYDLPIWEQVALFLLTGKHLAPLWFVPTIILFYLIAPILIWVDHTVPRLYWLIVPLFLLSTYLGRDGPYGPIDKAIYLFPAYLMGMAFSHYKEVGMMLVRRWWWFLMLIFVACFMAIILEWPQPPSYHLPMKMAACVLLVHALYKHHRIFGHRLDYIAEVSFGIFFVHAYFISAIKLLTVYLVHGSVYTGVGGDVIPGSILNLFIYAASVLFFSVAVIWVVKRVFGKYSRRIIGA